MGFFNACLGFAYIFSPIDMIPDFVPVAGNIDDTVLGAKLRDVKTKTVLELIDHGNSSRLCKYCLKTKALRLKTLNQIE
ncbi:YkvA family protein [Phormidesmis priestleyi]